MGGASLHKGGAALVSALQSRYLGWLVYVKPQFGHATGLHDRYLTMSVIMSWDDHTFRRIAQTGTYVNFTEGHFPEVKGCTMGLHPSRDANLADRKKRSHMDTDAPSGDTRDRTETIATYGDDQDQQVRIPDIGDKFHYRDHGYRVDAWLKRSEHTGRNLGPDNCPLEFCARDEAQYVSGYGVCGVIVRLSDVVITGRVPWTKDDLASARATAVALVGRQLR